MLSSVICHLYPEQDGLCSVLLDGQSHFGPHFTTMAPKSCESTHLKGPQQLWPPQLNPFAQAPLHLCWCPLPHVVSPPPQHLLVVVGAFQSNASYHSSALSSETGLTQWFQMCFRSIPRWGAELLSIFQDQSRIRGLLGIVHNPCTPPHLFHGGLIFK